uniref:Uncharacterized protein n=1 Tax=Timema monikensis TaxID=170555 RepID=A0A7R9E5X3_9NEOP|nr:unnamed protein product [Timema monikensis]
MDVEELRRSQRRLRKNQRPEKLTELPLISVSASVSGSQDSEDDDEDALTPSAETGERNLLSMLSISTESLDFVGKREKFLKNTFESLSGTEVDADRNNDTGGTSISSQFLVRTSQNINYLTTPFARNVAVINATKQTRSDNETSSKREELQRRIEETRRKLQSVGYRSNLKSSQSISDLSRIPEKDFRNHHGVNLAHRYTTSGGKKYAALIRHKMNYNTNPTLFFNTIVNINNLSSLKCKNHIALGTKNNIVYVYASKNQPKIGTCLFLKSQTTNLSARKLSGQSTNQPKKLKLSSGLLHRTDTYVSKVLPMLHFTSKHIPELILNTPKGTFSYFLKYKNTGKFQHYDSRINNSKPLTINISKHSNLFTKPLIKEQFIISSPTVCNVLQSVSVASSSVNVSMTALLENTPFKIIGESSCVEGSLEDSVLNSLISSSSNTNETNFNEIQCVYLQHDLSTKKRTGAIDLLSNSNSCTNFIKSHNSNLSITNQSLPESPVYENVCSSSKHFKNITELESKANRAHSGQQNRSCSYFINLNENVNTQDINSTTCINKSIKSSESLPLNLIETNYSSKENLLNSCGDEDNVFDNFSSDSLEEPTEFIALTPRRCTSDYQLSSYDLDTSEYEWRSASATDSHTERKKYIFHSQENLLSIKNSRLKYKIKDILEFYPNYEQDRHRSASFLLSSNNIKMTPCLSQDSILTTENEYHLSSCHQNESKLYMDKNKDSCKSTESFLESDCYSSSQYGDFHEIGGHQDSCQSTESILTDDSDYQVFKSPKKAVNHHEEKYKMSKKTKPLTLQEYNKVLKGKPIINNTCVTPNKLFSIVGHNFHTNDKISGINKSNNQTVFQTQSLQDANVSLSSLESHETNTPQYSIISSPSTRYPTCNKIINNNDSIETDINSALLRKKSYPISRPLTATSLQIHSQFAVLDSSNLKELDYGKHDLRNKNSQRNNKPPTAPKPISDKPPLKPQQKQIISPPMNKKSHTIYNVDLLTGMQKVSNQESFYSNYDKNTYLPKSKETTRIFLAKNTKKLPFIVREASNSSLPYQHDIFKGGKLTINNATKHECKLSKSVKLLCKTFENALEDYDPSDDCIADLEEDCFPVLGGSSSSTPATSSSAANSPKRLWPPASRAPVQRHLPKRMSSSHQPVLPNKKCSSVSGRMVSKSTSNTRTLSRHGTKQAASVNSVNIKRSTSMGVLNQSIPNFLTPRESEKKNRLPKVHTLAVAPVAVHVESTYQLHPSRARKYRPFYRFSQAANELNIHLFDTSHKDPDKPVPIQAGTHNKDFQTCHTTKILRAFPKQWELAHQWITKSRLPPGINRR